MNTNITDNFRVARVCGLPRHAPLPRIDNRFWFLLRLTGWRAKFPIEFACNSDEDAQHLIADINCCCIEAAYVELREGGNGEIVYLIREIGGGSTLKRVSTEFGEFDLFRELSPAEKPADVPPAGIIEPVPDQTTFADLASELLKRDEKECQPGD